MASVAAPVTMPDDGPEGADEVCIQPRGAWDFPLSRSEKYERLLNLFEEELARGEDDVVVLQQENERMRTSAAAAEERVRRRECELGMYGTGCEESDARVGRSNSNVDNAREVAPRPGPDAAASLLAGLLAASIAGGGDEAELAAWLRMAPEPLAAALNTLGGMAGGGSPAAEDSNCAHSAESLLGASSLLEVTRISTSVASEHGNAGNPSATSLPVPQPAVMDSSATPREASSVATSEASTPLETPTVTPRRSATAVESCDNDSAAGKKSQSTRPLLPGLQLGQLGASETSAPSASPSKLLGLGLDMGLHLRLGTQRTGTPRVFSLSSPRLGANNLGTPRVLPLATPRTAGHMATPRALSRVWSLVTPRGRSVAAASLSPQKHITSSNELQDLPEENPTDEQESVAADSKGTAQASSASEAASVIASNLSTPPSSPSAVATLRVVEPAPSAQTKRQSLGAKQFDEAIAERKAAIDIRCETFENKPQLKATDFSWNNLPPSPVRGRRSIGPPAAVCPPVADKVDAPDTNASGISVKEFPTKEQADVEQASKHSTTSQTSAGLERNATSNDQSRGGQPVQSLLEAASVSDEEWSICDDDEFECVTKEPHAQARSNLAQLRTAIYTVVAHARAATGQEEVWEVLFALCDELKGVRQEDKSFPQRSVRFADSHRACGGSENIVHGGHIADPANGPSSRVQESNAEVALFHGLGCGLGQSLGIAVNALPKQVCAQRPLVRSCLASASKAVPKRPGLQPAQKLGRSTSQDTQEVAVPTVKVPVAIAHKPLKPWLPPPR